MNQRAFPAVVFAVLGLGVATADAYDLTLTPGTQYQTMEGWGTSGVVNSTAWRTAYRDLGLNIIRVYAAKEVLVDASGDYRVPVTLGTDLQANINRMNFTGVSTINQYGQFAQWMNSNALEPDRVKVVADVWSPPHWMKGPSGSSQYWIGNTNNSLGTTAYPTPWLSNEHNGWGGFSHSGDSIGGRLKTEDAATLEQYGRYMAAWVKGFEQNFNVPIYRMSLQNESTFENPFDSMTYIVNQSGAEDFTQYAKGLKAVKDAWQQFGITTKVVGPHVANLGSTPANPWALRLQQSMIDGVRSHSDPALKDFISAYNSNYYMNADRNAVVMTAGYYHGADEVTWPTWPQTYFTPRGVEDDGKPIWYSETGDAGNTWADNLKMAAKIHNALTYSDASAYIYWQFTDGTSVGEYSLLGTNQLANPTASKKYAAFKQYSRFIRPGAVRIGALFENGRQLAGTADAYDSPNAVNASAFFHDEDDRLTIVLLNELAGSQPISIVIPEGMGAESFEVYRTSATENFLKLTDLLVVDGKVTFNIPGDSIMTLTTVVPEPTSFAMVALAEGALLSRRRP